MSKVLAGLQVTALTWPKDGLVLEHVEEHPKRFMTKQSLRDYCKKHGYSSGALL